MLNGRDLTGKRLLLITGMHRSGTSFITSLCHIFGVDLPANLVPADRWNKRGYFEAAEVQSAQERLLEALDRGWFDLRPFPEDWIDRTAGRFCMDELRGFLQRSFASSSSLVIKDPRSSLLIPLWAKLADEYGIDLRVLIVVRRPGQVARSLEIRDHMNPLIGMALWWRHTVGALAGAKDRANGVVIYEDVLRDPKILFDLLRGELGMIDGGWSGEMERAALACIDTDFDWSPQDTAGAMPVSIQDASEAFYQELTAVRSVPPDMPLAIPREVEEINAWFPEWRRLFVRHLSAMRTIDAMNRSQTRSMPAAGGMPEPGHRIAK